MSRHDIKQDEVQSIILKLFRDGLDLNESRCYEVTKPDQLPKVPSGSDYVVTLSFGDGTFPIDEQFDGQLCESIDLTVMVFTRINLDSTNTDKMLLHDDKRGLLKLKALVLKTVFDNPDPGRESGGGFLRDWLSVKRSIAPDMLEAKTGIVGGVGLVFAVTFDWDMSDS